MHTRMAAQLGVLTVACRTLPPPAQLPPAAARSERLERSLARARLHGGGGRLASGVNMEWERGGEEAHRRRGWRAL